MDKPVIITAVGGIIALSLVGVFTLVQIRSKMKNLDRRIDARKELLERMETNMNPTREDILLYILEMDNINSMPV
jgi:hypothetical protein